MASREESRTGILPVPPGEARRVESASGEAPEKGEEELTAETGPDDVAAMRQRQEGVRECLDKLPPEHRECIHLAYYEGWTLEEISAQMSVKKETVGTRLFYARKRIQACLSALLAREHGLQETSR